VPPTGPGYAAPVSRVLVDVTDRVATVTLNDPDRRNAFDLALCDEVAEAFDRIEADPEVGAVVVTGAPPAFCAGADLTHLGSSTSEGLLAVYEGFLRVGRCPLPTIAAVNGPAVGAGMNLALVTDLRIAGRSARFDSRFLQLGIHPGGGHTWMLRRLAGPETTFAVDLFGEILDGEAAAAAGIAWRCVDDDRLLAVSQELAGRAAAGPPELVAKIKASIKAVAAIDEHDDAVRLELDPQAWSVEQPAFQAGLAKLRERMANKK
jgi:enoyl-CoA hydratase